MSWLFWAFATAMLVIATAFVVAPLRTGKSLLETPVALVVTLVPFVAVSLYAFLGSHHHLESSHAPSLPAQSMSTRSADERPLGSVASMVDGLVARLEREPDDADGWVLLARSYQYIGQHADAVRAYGRAQALGKTDPNLETLLSGKHDDSAQPSDASGPAIRGRVALSPDATAQVAPTDTLFVFAKESRDHRMPVAALRKSVTDLPLEFLLTDEQIMVPGTQLSDYEELVVTARISRNGNASDDSLGLEAWSDSVTPGNSTRVDLLVDATGGSRDD